MMQEVQLQRYRESTSSTAVRIRDAYKRYSKNAVILKGMNMTVPSGMIYSLLGPSGCGKTTLLSCIVGQNQLDAGSIEVGVGRREKMGYMPQSLCLHLRMTILENFYFYGYLFGMDEKRIEERMKDLMAFLELPSKQRIIADLSGGQQRRVSVAITLIHEPELLILDEPTVGLDPVLSHSIWLRLKDMAKMGKSIIITTHYIQEAQHADVIGLMRDGVLIAEETPYDLMQRCDCSDLEDAFLQLSKKQNTISNESCTAEYVLESKKSTEVYFEDNEKVFSIKKFNGLFYKNLVLLRRDYMLLITALVLPFLNTYLFNVAVGRNPRGLSIAVVNDEISMVNCSLAAYDSCFLDDNRTIPLSCLYMNVLRTKDYNIIEYANETVALNEVKQNKAWALLHFTHNFSAALASKLANGLNVDATDLVQSSVNTWIDSTNKLFQGLIMYDVTRVMASVLEQAMVSCGMNPKIGHVPIKFEQPIFGSFDENFISYASCALICIDCFVLPSVWTCIQMFLEKSDGILERTMVTGVRVLDMTAAVFVFQFLIQSLQTIIGMVVMYLMFENPLRGSVCTFFSLMTITGTAGIFYGIALGIFADNFLSLGALSNFVLMSTCLITGLMWPAEAMHYVLKILTWLFPISWIVSATRAICLRSFSFFTPVVLMGFMSALILNVGFILAIFLIAKYKKTAFTVGK